MIIVVFGLPGSGKSFFAARLAEALVANYVNSDVLRKKMFLERTYSQAEKTVVYDAMVISMKEAIRKKENLVLDATFHKRETRNMFIEKARETVFFIEVWAAEAIIKDRLLMSRPFSEADIKVYQLIKKEWEPLRLPHLVLESTNENIDEMLQKAEEYLNYDARTN